MIAPADGRRGDTLAARDMAMGRVYLWHPDRARSLGGSLTLGVVPLERLDPPGTQLSGRYVEVRNAGQLNEPDAPSGALRTRTLGSARPDSAGNFVFDHGRGGGRVDKALGTAEFRARYIEAARFGEVNTYFHVDRIADYVDSLLRDLGARSLPRVVAVVNAHHGAVDRGDGVRDGRMLRGRWRPFQGGHYRVPSRRYDVHEYETLSPTGEIHLGPGRKILTHGALVELAGRSYRANAAHNPGIIYHEYGHHITQHTADFRGNALKSPARQNNRKTALDEGTCDYWTAVMLDTPHIWACHRRHDSKVVHPRSLVSTKTMTDFDWAPGADPHLNGTVWGAALWDMRSRLVAEDRDGGRGADLLVLQALRLIVQLGSSDREPSIASVRQARADIGSCLDALLRADELLARARRHDIIRGAFAARGIVSAGQRVASASGGAAR